MEKTACTDKEFILFFREKADLARAAVAAFARTESGVTVYTLLFRFGIIAAFPKKRRICFVQQIFPHTVKKNRSKNRRFTTVYYDGVVIPPKKPALLFPGSA
jgi:hypothetical protein